MKLPDIHFANTPFEIGMVVPLSEEVRYSFIKLPAGTPVTIRSFTETSSGFANNNGMLPGIYENFRWLNVELPDGRPERVPEHYLDATGLTRVLRERAKISDLPESPFCEGDTVVGPDKRYAKIVNIDYLSIWRQSTGDRDDNPRPYTLQPTDSSEQINATAAEMKLVNRGPIYHFYNGCVIDFDNAEDEANFYGEIGQSDGLINPANNTRAFSREEAIEVLQAGEADAALSHKNRFEPLSDYRPVYLTKFRDAAVGARIREAYMDTLNLAAPKFG
jgi:hypothetical protein